MPKNTIGYIVVDGQLGKGRTGNNLFTGGVLIPEGAKAGMIYTKLKDDIFKRNTSINGVESDEELALNFKNLYEIAYEKGENNKFKNMQQMARARFDSPQWWDIDEVIVLRNEMVGGVEKNASTDCSTPTALKVKKKRAEFHDKTDIGSELTLSEDPGAGKIKIEFCKQSNRRKGVGTGT